MKALANICELLGISAVIYGSYLVTEWLAWLVGGVALVLAGLALDYRK